MSSVDFISKIPEKPPVACPICREEIQPEDKVLGHQVNKLAVHNFHENCLTTWTAAYRSCPLCRARISSINGQPILNEAAQLQPVVTALMERGEAVERAARDGNLEEVQLLLANRAPIGYWDRLNALEHAILHGNLEMVRLLLATGFPLRREIKLFKLAFSNADLEIGRLLLTHITLTDWDLFLIIKEAPSHLRPEVVRLMIESGIDSANLSSLALDATFSGFIDVPLAQALLANRATIPISHRLAVIYGNFIYCRFGVAAFLLKNWVWSS